MACYHPLDAYQSLEKKSNGKYTIRFNDVYPYTSLPIKLPCGQCIGCRLNYSRQWAIRCTHEASLYENNCFITLTYNDEHLPYDNSINVRHFQLFMKRLRKKFPNHKIRFFHCGEYGDKLGRPHYHACIFNFDFPDREFWKEQNNMPLFTSQILSDLWGKGFCSVGNVTFESAAYVARYIVKKINGEQALDHYTNYNKITGEIIADKTPEYTTMSRRPGIGKKWFDQFKSDVYPSDEIIINGKPCRPPKFYDSQFEIIEPNSYDKIKEKRAAQGFKQSYNNTPERLRVREIIATRKVEKLVRTI